MLVSCVLLTKQMKSHSVIVIVIIIIIIRNRDEQRFVLNILPINVSSARHYLQSIMVFFSLVTVT